MPTEEEWEFTTRGGNSSNGDTYAGSNTVGGKTANELGLYDMSGNVYEWCWDLYGSYAETAQTDYRGDASGTCRVQCGGGWGDHADYCTVANRYIIGDPCDRYNDFGFRVVRP